CAQLQQHLADLLAAATQPASIVGSPSFRYLPPFGVVPLQRPPLRGFLESTFFAGVVRRPVPGSNQGTPFIDVRVLGQLQEQALAVSPTDLTSREFIWLYRPWQNVKAIDDHQSVQ